MDGQVCLYGYILLNGEKIGEKGKYFVGTGRGIRKEIYRYFPAGTTESYVEPSAGAPICRHGRQTENCLADVRDLTTLCSRNTQ
jgi:hypothetical protein